MQFFQIQIKIVSKYTIYDLNLAYLTEIKRVNFRQPKTVKIHHNSSMTTTTDVSIKINKVEQAKAEKDGLDIKQELESLIQLGWENIDKTDLELRLKWLGVFFRPVTPGKFMLRLRIPNGSLDSEKMRVLANIVQRYGDDGSADITTRQNIQLRGVRLEDIPEIFRQLQSVNLTSMQSGMDNVRNLTGSPVAGIDADELVDTRDMLQKLQDMITNNGEGNYAFTNLPRKFNIAIEGGRDNSIHAEINDIAFIPAYRDGELGFNVLVGGYLSAQRCVEAIPLNAWVPVNEEDVINLSGAILTVYTKNGLKEGLRKNRQKARMMWLIDKWGVEQFRAEVEKTYGKELLPAAPENEITQEKKDYIGVYPQKQPGYSYVGLLVPVGRLSADTMFDLARLADVYGNGEIRLTVEQNLIIPYIANEKLEAFLSEPLLQQFPINPSTLTRSLVSCTGNRYCNFAIIETKQRALKLAQELDQELDIPQRVRIHWTGCPNSCGQPQVADIGLMGTKVRKDGTPVEGVNLYTGGKVGKDAKLGDLLEKGIACDDLKPILRNLLIENFEAKLKDGVVLEPEPDIQETVQQKTQPSPETETNGDQAQTKIFFAGSWKQVDCNSQEFILNTAESQGIEIESSCRAGTCGTCAKKLLKGRVKYEENYDALADLEEGMVLTCCALPEGQVVIDA